MKVLLLFFVGLIFVSGRLWAVVLPQTEVDKTYSFDHPHITINPYDQNDLAALIEFTTLQPVQVTVTVSGKNGAADISYGKQDFQTIHRVEVIGLYPNYNNQVVLRIKDRQGNMQKKTVQIQTDKIRKWGTLFVRKKKQAVPRYYYFTEGIVLDEDGHVRFNFETRGNRAYYLNREIVVDSRIEGLKRYSLVGELLQTYPWPENYISFAHGLSQKPNKNYLSLGSFRETTALINGKEELTQRDFVIEIDYQTGALIKKWDLAEILNPNRGTIVKAGEKDYGINNWCHINGIDYDATDKSLVVSCRHQGVVKIDDETGKLLWILTPHNGLDRSGRDGHGPALWDKALTAVRLDQKPYAQSVQEGIEKADMFKWPTRNHNPRVYAGSLVSLFDNAGEINDKLIITTSHSVASLYRINEKTHTVAQVWRQDLPDFSAEGSSVEYNPNKQDVIVYVSRIMDSEQNNTAYGVLRRYDFFTHELLFDAVLVRGGTHYFYAVDEFSF